MGSHLNNTSISLTAEQRFARAAKLFAFEFAVVLLGVFVAQMLQSMSAETQARTQTAEAIDKLRLDIGRLREITAFWQKYGECLADHTTQIATVAANGATMPTAEIGRPALPLPQFTSWSETTILNARRWFGETPINNYRRFGQNADVMLNLSRDIAREWAAFGLLDPAYGTPSEADRANVRLAAMRIRTLIKMEIYKAREVLDESTRIGVTPADQDYTAVVNDCGLLRNW